MPTMCTEFRLLSESQVHLFSFLFELVVLLLRCLVTILQGVEDAHAFFWGSSSGIYNELFDSR